MNREIVVAREDKMFVRAAEVSATAASDDFRERPEKIQVQRVSVHIIVLHHAIMNVVDALDVLATIKHFEITFFNLPSRLIDSQNIASK